MNKVLFAVLLSTGIVFSVNQEAFAGNKKPKVKKERRKALLRITPTINLRQIALTALEIENQRIREENRI